MSTLQLIAVKKTFGEHRFALGEVTFALEEGQLGVLVGPSGCGKSTTLRLVAGLETPDQGSIYLGERNLHGIPPHQRGVAMAFQSPALFAHMTVAKNFAVALRARRVPAPQISERVRRAANLLQITHLLDRHCYELSGGEQQRVALGKAIVQQPRLWLLDEPLASLDPPLRRQLGRDIATLQQLTKTTTLFVTHDQSEAMAYGNWLIVMKEGVIQQSGTPLEIYRRPANRFVAAFVGDPPMNLIVGEIRKRKFRAQTLTVDLSGPARNGSAELGIRAEHIRLADPDEPSAVRAIVQRIEYQGHASIVEVQAGPHRMSVRTDAGRTLACGQAVGLILPPQHCYLFEHSAAGTCVATPAQD